MYGTFRYRSHDSEEGYILVVAVFAVALVILALAVATPQIRKELQRDREVEAIHRGKQYTRAIQLYYRKFHTFPQNIDGLMETNGIRFLRRRYADPISMRNDWKPILAGQNKAPTAMGYFGQPLFMEVTASSTTGSSDNTVAQDSSNPSDADESTEADDDLQDEIDQNGDESNADSSQNTATTQTGLVFGGGIIGFSPNIHKRSILVYKTKSRYNLWEFVYDPRADLSLRGLAPVPLPTGPPTNSGSPGFNAGSAGSNSSDDGSSASSSSP